MMMFAIPRQRLHRVALAALLAAALTPAAPCLAQATAAAPADASESAMVNLVRLLVKQGVITKANGDTLMQQAVSEAEAARARAATAAPQVAGTEPPAPPPGTIRVPYVPQSVRDQIRDEIKGEVMAQAKSEGWASPEQAAPDWTRRIALHGDVRFRSQSELYGKRNGTQFLDFSAFNSGAPFIIAGATTNLALPYLNSTTDRDARLKLRARLGLTAQISPEIEAGITVASGDDNSPISTDQSLAGGLGKRDLWLDQAYISYNHGGYLKGSLGRFVNPFESTELLFDPDLRFDGISGEVDAARLLGAGENVSFVVRGGAFPLTYASPNYPTDRGTKSRSADQYLFSGQVSATAKLNDGGLTIGASAAYHHFKGVQGQLSEPCDPTSVTGVQECSTDYQRSIFLRKGNTLFPLRQIVSVTGDPNVLQPQYFGLLFKYDVLDLIGRVKFPVMTDTVIDVTGDFVKNLAFHRSDVCRLSPIAVPINNVSGAGNVCATTNPDKFLGGGTGYLGSVALRHGALPRQGSWEAVGGYRYLESDAVLDSLTDSDFHLGGTNAKGYFVGGKYAFTDGMTIGGRWLSANEISGAPFAIDVLQFDIGVEF